MTRVETSSKEFASERNRKRAAEQLIRTEIEFISNRDFTSKDVTDSVERVIPKDTRNSKSDLPPHLRRLCETDLLSKEEEATLFREMNLLKFQANVLRSRLNPKTATGEQLDAIESRLSQAQSIRDHIIKANMRLVISVVKKFVTPQQSFDEMLSDGIITLMQAVEKFDYDRGFRFSTYAYRSIARDAYRKINSARIEEARFTRDAEQWAFAQEEGQSASSMTDQMWHNLRELMTSMLGNLDRRERFIVRCRYALGSHRKVRSYQFIADKLGVSKERVRQIARRAVGKMQSMAAELNSDQLFVAAIV